MRISKSVLFTVFFLSIPSLLWAVTCADFSNEEQMRTFLNQSREAYPLIRDNFSSVLSVSPCEKSDCSKKNIAKRKKNQSLVHSMRIGTEKRTYFMEGNDHPICVVSKGIRKFKCSDCGGTYNDQCRSFNSSTAIEGTNLDAVDMELLTSPDFALSCKPVPKSTKFFFIEAIKKGGDSPYDKISIYHENNRGVLIQIRYFAQNVLRKVYRISPKNYIKVGDDWVASDIKVRTVQGSEKKYTFETRVKLDYKGKEPQAFADPLADPYVEGTDMGVLFSTN